MTRVFIYVLLLIGFSSCNSPTELSIGEKEKPADSFARQFIGNVISGQLDSCYNNLSPELLNEQTKSFIINANKSINGAIVKKYKVVENTPTYLVFSPHKTEKFSNYKLAYEYEFEKGNILFMTTVQQRDNKLFITAFNGIFLKAPLAEITQFRLTKASPVQLIFILFGILVPIFIIISLIVMLFSSMTTKSKVGWAFLIMFINLPKLIVDGTTGQINFQLLPISMFGSGFFRTALYYGWSIFFSVPLGAIAFWVKRKKSLNASTIVEIKSPINTEEQSILLKEYHTREETPFVPS